MRLQAHHKIHMSYIILIVMCTHVLHVSAVETSDAKEVGESLEEISDDSVKQDLDKAESKDGQKLEIIKQIRKLNNDGSYTVGYEAEDGTFKIESRDVLGNVKGTFGYVDANGEIKRVSYTSSNGTAVKSTPTSDEDPMHNIPRYNRSAASPTTRRPSYSSGSPSSPTRSTVIQTIPRRLRISSGSHSSTERPSGRDNLSTKSPTVNKEGPTTTIVYATSVPTPKPYVNIRPTPLPSLNHKPAEQISRPEKLEIHQASKVLSSRDTSTTKPVTETVEETDVERKPYRGNALRRQLMQEAEQHTETRQQLIYSQTDDDDAGHVYSALSASARPLFTTTHSPRISPIVLAARHRAAQIQNSIAQQQQQQQTTEKYYIKARRQEHRDQAPTTEPTSEHSYLTQNPIPVQIPANKQIIQQGEEERSERRVLRRPSPHPADLRHRQPQYIRVQTVTNENPSTERPDSPRLVRIPLPQAAHNNNEQYLRETTPTPVKNEPTSEQEPVQVQIPREYYRVPTTSLPPVAQQQSPQFYVYPQPEQVPAYTPQPPPNYPVPYNVNPYRGAPYGPQYLDQLERPLTTRDFERLLQILIYRHQQRQNFGYVPYPVPGYQQYLRPNLYNPYDIRTPFRGPISPYAEPENVYQAQNPIPTTDPGMSYELQRLIPRKKHYNPRYYGAQTPAYSMEDYGSTALPIAQQPSPTPYLPPDVREELLYRMLMLALQSEPQTAVVPHSMTPSPSSALDPETSTTTKSPVVYKKPIRSVQILGEE